MLSRRCPAASIHPSVIITLISNRFADCPRVNWIFQLGAATARLARRENGDTSPFRSIVARAKRKKKKRKKEREMERNSKWGMENGKLARGWAQAREGLAGP